MISKHEHLDLYPIPSYAEKLILGTIHPAHTERFKIPFFYGNKASLWQIFSDAFPEELPYPLSLKKILDFLEKRKIAVSDTIKTCFRKKDTALDQDLEPIELNMDLIAQIKASNIKEIYCTSVYAFKLFYEGIMAEKITKEILKERQICFYSKRLARNLCLYILYSPSGAANVGLSNTALYKSQKEKYKNSTRPVYDFKVDYYKSFFKK